MNIEDDVLLAIEKLPAYLESIQFIIVSNKDGERVIVLLKEVTSLFERYSIYSSQIYLICHPAR